MLNKSFLEIHRAGPDLRSLHVFLWLPLHPLKDILIVLWHRISPYLPDHWKTLLSSWAGMNDTFARELALPLYPHQLSFFRFSHNLPLHF